MNHIITSGVTSLVSLPWRWALVLITFSMMLMACDDDPNRRYAPSQVNNDSETHWLSACTQDSDCQDELSCLCGVCTLECDSPGECSRLSEAAFCLIEEDGECSPMVTGTCRMGCEGDEDCANNPEAPVCDDGQCVAEEPANNGDPNNGGNNSAPESDAQLCQLSDGVWNEAACGHYQCGQPNACAAVIPGCDCGPDANFVEGEGCVEDPVCAPEPIGDEALCINSGGAWDEAACGHYECGQTNLCNAIIPGCDCGPGSNFVEGEGCIEDPVCQSPEPTGDEALCVNTLGVWDAGACGHYQCGQVNECLALVPGCNCGPDSNFVEGEGCVEAPVCRPPEPMGDEALCINTRGRWDEGTCGHYQCGQPNGCLAIVPGCNCGFGANFVEGEGCVEALCENASEQDMCQTTGGEWDVNACSHYRCGVLENDCDGPTPGCNCGPEGVFDERFGCQVDNACPVAQERLQGLCEETRGTWLPAVCEQQHYICGSEPDCSDAEDVAFGPACNCGLLATFDENQGCVETTRCQERAQPSPEDLCGPFATWSEAACGHSLCGDPVASCDETMPACNCDDPRQVFMPGRGCVFSSICNVEGGSGEHWRVDPKTIRAFDLPINSIRFSVAGYVPEERTCVGVVWFEQAIGRAERWLCGHETSEQPYVVVETDVDRDFCETWDYSGNAELLAPVDGCVRLGVSEGGLYEPLVDFAVKIRVEGNDFESTVAFHNLQQYDPAPTPVNLRVISNDQRPVYVQTRNLEGQPDWFRLTNSRGERLMTHDPCGIPACDTGEIVCASNNTAIQEAQVVDGNVVRNHLFARAWDSQIRVVRQSGCFERITPYIYNNYLFVMCYGHRFTLT